MSRFLDRFRAIVLPRSVLLVVLLVFATSLAVTATLVAGVGLLTEDAGLTRRLLTSILLPVLGITLAAAMLGFYLLHRIHRPVLQLVEAAARLRQGDLTTPVPAVRERDLSPLAEELEAARTELRDHLGKIARMEARHKAFIAALREPILTANPEGFVTGCSWSAQELFGQQRHIIGLPIQDLLPFLAGKPFGEGARITWQGQVEDAFGRSLDLEVNRTVLIEEGGSPSHIYTLYDVSHHAEASRMREQLLYNIAHELRTPLAVLQNALELLNESYATLAAEELRHLLGAALRTSRRLENLMTDLLSAGSIQAGRFIVNPRPVRLAQLVQEAIEDIIPMTETRGQKVEPHLCSKDLQVLADPRAVTRVLTNLLSNAAKYGPGGQPILVEAETVDGAVRVTVADQGPGIPEEQRAGLFDRFYRVKTGNDEPGIGLGLAIVKGIAEAHGGSVGVASEPGAGTRVWFTLPVVS